MVSCLFAPSLTEMMLAEMVWVFKSTGASARECAAFAQVLRPLGNVPTIHFHFGQSKRT